MRANAQHTMGKCFKMQGVWHAIQMNREYLKITVIYTPSYLDILTNNMKDQFENVDIDDILSLLRKIKF